METKKIELTCIGCPMGCPLTVTMEDCAVASVTGNTCPRGDAYARKEVTAPTRIVTSTVRVSGGLGTGSAGFLGNIVHQIMHMQHIACGKHAGDAGLQAFVDQRPTGDGA